MAPQHWSAWELFWFFKAEEMGSPLPVLTKHCKCCIFVARGDLRVSPGMSLICCASLRPGWPLIFRGTSQRGIQLQAQEQRGKDEDGEGMDEEKEVMLVIADRWASTILCMNMDTCLKMTSMKPVIVGSMRRHRRDDADGKVISSCGARQGYKYLVPLSDCWKNTPLSKWVTSLDHRADTVFRHSDQHTSLHIPRGTHTRLWAATLAVILSTPFQVT